MFSENQIKNIVNEGIESGEISAGTKLYLHYLYDNTTDDSLYFITASNTPINNIDDIITLLKRDGYEAPYLISAFIHIDSDDYTSSILSVTSNGSIVYIDDVGALAGAVDLSSHDLAEDVVIPL